MSDEFYARPIFRVRDVERSITYYCQKLGFTSSWKSGDDRPIIAQVGRNGLDVILASGAVTPSAGLPSVLSMSLHQPGNLRALHRELLDRGARIVSAPFEVDWQEGTYQLEVEDPDGNVLIFWGSGTDEGQAGASTARR